MSKKKIPQHKPAEVKPLIKKNWYEQPNVMALALSAIAILLYAVTFHHEWALDDVMSITMNSFTQKGWAGISDLFTRDSFYGFIGNESDLSGGRWRPLALLSFATEIEFFGWKKGGPDANLELAHIMHINNVLLYGTIAFTLFHLLNKHITKNLWSAGIITLLFVVHPIHSEVVANIKSRDELLSWFFLLLTLFFALDYPRKKKFILLPLSLTCFFLALLSKEYGVTFLAILPITFFCFANLNWGKSFLATLPFAIVIAVYVGLRFSFLSISHKEITEVMNAPFLLATPAQALATKVFVLGKYLYLLFLPLHLNYDYSYNQIPYTDFGDWRVRLSVGFQIALLIYAFKEISKRNLIAYGILFYFFTMFIVSNLAVNTGGVLCERFLFQPSFGFLIALVTAANFFIQKIRRGELLRRAISVSLVVLIVVPASYKTYSRSMDWKNDKTLFVKDVRTNPNSARTNNGGGTQYIFLGDDAKEDSVRRKLCYDSAVYFLKAAMKIHPTYTDPYLNMGVAYDRKKMPDSAEYYWNHARELQPDHPKLREFYVVLANDFFSAAGKIYESGNTPRAISYYRKAVKYDATDSRKWYNLAGIYFTTQHYDSARICFNQTLKLDPADTLSMKAIRALDAMGK